MASGAKKTQANVDFWNQQSQQQLQQLQQPSETQKLIDERNKKFLDWDAQAGHNVKDAPGLSDYIQIGRAAQDRAKQERFGTGALQLGEDGQKPYLENLKSLRQSEQAENFGSGLENALAMKRAEVSGSALPFAQLDLQRKTAGAGIASQAMGQWLNRQAQQKTWWDYLKDISQMGMQAAQTYAGMGGG